MLRRVSIYTLCKPGFWAATKASDYKTSRFSFLVAIFLAFLQRLSTFISMKRKTDLSTHQRNLMEKGRRRQMKDLLSKLAPLVHPAPSMLSGPEVLDRATIYVKDLQKRIEELKRRKKTSSRIPVLHITRSKDETIVEVNLITGLWKNFKLHEVIRVLQEEGAEIISLASHICASDCVRYTIRSQPISVRIGMEISTIEERIKELVY